MLIPALCREHVTPEMFFTTHALPSPTSAEGGPPLFGGSQVLRHGPTSPARTCPHCGLWPSRTGLDPKTKACWRSPGSRACCLISVRGLYRLRRTGQPLANITDRKSTRLNSSHLGISY